MEKIFPHVPNSEIEALRREMASRGATECRVVDRGDGTSDLVVTFPDGDGGSDDDEESLGWADDPADAGDEGGWPDEETGIPGGPHGGGGGPG